MYLCGQSLFKGSEVIVGDVAVAPEYQIYYNFL